MKYGDLTYEEIRDAAQPGLPRHHPHRMHRAAGTAPPCGLRYLVRGPSVQRCVRKADRDHGVQSLVLPAIPFGPTPEHRNYGAGYIDIPVDLYDSLVMATLESLATQGFLRIVVWRGCGGHDLREAVKRFNEACNGRSTAFLPGLPYHDVWCRIADPSVPGGHADSFTTSITLHLRPEAVRRDRIVDPQHKPVDWEDPDIDFASYSSTGVIGDPTHASAELGAKLWEAVVDEVAETLRSIAEDSGPVSPVDEDRLHFLQHSNG